RGRRLALRPHEADRRDERLPHRGPARGRGVRPPLPGRMARGHGRVDRARDQAGAASARDPGPDERGRWWRALAVGVPRDHVHGPHPVHPAAREHPQRAAAAAEPAAQEGRRGGRMAPQSLGIAMSVALLFAVILLVRSYVPPEKYAVIWIVASVAAIVLSAWPELLDAVSRFFGISQSINLLFVG